MSEELNDYAILSPFSDGHWHRRLDQLLQDLENSARFCRDSVVYHDGTLKKSQSANCLISQNQNTYIDPLQTTVFFRPYTSEQTSTKGSSTYFYKSAHWSRKWQKFQPKVPG